MESFNKVAVGDVREEFLKTLKQKMNQKFKFLTEENEKTSEQSCIMFLQQNYEPIAQKLRNQDYQSLDELSTEIKHFLLYFLDEGPKGPQRQTIAQEFCYKALNEGAVYFNKSI